MKEWIKGLFSLEERKFSTIMFSFIAFVAISIYILLQSQTIPIGLVYIVLGLGGYICGYNVIPQLFGNSGMYGSSYGNYGSNYNSNSLMDFNTSITPNNNNDVNGSV